jgi:hypothetical protein
MFLTIMVATFAAVQTNGLCNEMVPHPRPGNALSEFADDKFNSWTLSPRIDVPLGANLNSIPIPQVSGQRIDAAGNPVSTFPLRSEYRIVAMTVGKEEAAEKELNKLAQEGFELVNTTNPMAPDARAAPTTVHFILKRTIKP